MTLFTGCRRIEERPALDPDAEILSVLDRELHEACREAGLPGLSVAVLAGTQVVFARGYGWANRERRTPVTVDTLFPIASIEKEFTAAAVMRLVEQGKLRLEDPIGTYLPELDTGGHEITIRHMLQQVSGLQGGETLEAWWSRSEAGVPPDGRVAAPRASRIRVGAGFTPGDDVARFLGAPLYHPPGERWTYSQPNYDLLCLVIADLTGGTYYEAIGELARAADIPFHPEWTPPPARDLATTAHGYARAPEGLVPVWEENPGSGWTTATGLVRWAQALASGAIVTQASYDQMTTPVRLNDSREWLYGMGLVLGTFEGHRAIEHTGNIAGFTSVLVHYPDEDLSVAVMTNLGYTLAASAIKQHISRLLLGLPEPTFRDLPVSAAERARHLGLYDAGEFWFEILEDGERLTLVMRGPGFEGDPWVALRASLLYQGAGHFVAEDDPDVIQVWFEQPGAPPGEISVTIAGSGWRPQAVRIRRSATHETD